MSGIFISYRRQDSDAYAGRLYDRLSVCFDKARIFMDVDMNLGIDFVDEIDQRVSSCEVLIAVIGRSWLEIKDNEGRRRLNDPKDWVRLEIAAALERDIPVIPALVGGAKMPGTSDLPAVLSQLTRRQAIEISHTGFHSDAERLIRGLERILTAKSTDNRTILEPSKPGPQREIPKVIHLDPQTRLMWTIADNGKNINWHWAKTCAKNLRVGGYSDWRLPTIEALEGLYDPKEKTKIRRPIKLTRWWLNRGCIWSSTEKSDEGAWYFCFYEGKRYGGRMSRSIFRALYVRGSGE